MSKRVIISVQEFVNRFCNSCRVYESDGLFYVFRDIPIGDKRLQPQYAVVDNSKDDGSLIWADCHEGALFTDVAPLVGPDHDRIAVLDTGNPWYNQGVNTFKWPV